MPYISVDAGRYLGEHSCGRYHYGDQAMVRDCCVDDAKRWKAVTLAKAITTSHPAYRLFCAAYDSLTVTERWIVGDLKPVYDHGPAGFDDIIPQAELPV